MELPFQGHVSLLILMPKFDSVERCGAFGPAVLGGLPKVNMY